MRLRLARRARRCMGPAAHLRPDEVPRAAAAAGRPLRAGRRQRHHRPQQVPPGHDAGAIGQNVIVENKAGASGAIGSAEVARAKPDGHVLLIANTTTQSSTPSAMSDVSYDAVKDFAPIAVITVVPTGVAIHPSMPVRNLKQLVAFARANPEQAFLRVGRRGKHHQPHGRAVQEVRQRASTACTCR